MLLPTTTLNDAEITALEDFLLSDNLGDCHDFLGAHGFLCAAAVGPGNLPEAEVLSQLLDVPVAQLTSAELHAGCERLLHLKHRFDAALYHAERIHIPCDLSLSPAPDDAPLRSWAAGFMDFVLLSDALWYDQQDEATVAQLLLPFVLASGLHDDPELLALERNRKLGQQILQQIPEVMVDLYLLYRTGSLSDETAN